MQNLFNELAALLKQDTRFWSGDQILKNQVIEYALKLDKELLRLLLSHPRLKEHFFTDVGGVLVFDKEKFIRFVNNKAFLPDSYTSFKNKIGLMTEDGHYLSESREVVLAWPYKDCVLEGGQTKEDQKRDEIFWNTILAPDEIDRLFEPKVLTNWKRYDAEGEHPVTEIRDTDNLIIKGNNLLALHSLKKRFAGKVKLIYIDPPYYFRDSRKGDTFAYNSSFKLSSWLTFMENRIDIARQLLSDDGAIIIQISDDGVGWLRVLLDEIFGSDNFVNQITVKTRSPSGFKTVNLGVFESAEYLLLYARDKRKWKYKPQYVATKYDENYKYFIPNVDDNPSNWKIELIADVVSRESGYGDANSAKEELGRNAFREKLAEFALKNAERVFRFTTINPDAGKDTLAAKKESLSQPDKVFVVEREDFRNRYILNGQEITFYVYKVREIDGEEKPTTMLTNIWTDIPWEGIAGEGKVKLKRGKKPEKLLNRIIDMSTDAGDIVLDFFLGSGTTAAVAHKMGRQYIGIEQLDYGENDSVVRLQNVINGDQTGISKSVGWQGGGSFIYCELMQWNECFVERVRAAESKAALQAIWQEMQEKAHLSYRLDLRKFNEHAAEFADLSLEEQKRFLLETLDANQLYVNLNEMDDESYSVSEADKRLNKLFYNLG